MALSKAKPAPEGDELSLLSISTQPYLMEHQKCSRRPVDTTPSAEFQPQYIPRKTSP